jgi:hypothetical protein
MGSCRDWVNAEQKGPMTSTAPTTAPPTTFVLYVGPDPADPDIQVVWDEYGIDVYLRTETEPTEPPLEGISASQKGTTP